MLVVGGIVVVGGGIDGGGIGALSASAVNARVVTVPSNPTLRSVELPVSATEGLPELSAAIALG